MSNTLFTPAQLTDEEIQRRVDEVIEEMKQDPKWGKCFKPKNPEYTDIVKIKQLVGKIQSILDKYEK